MQTRRHRATLGREPRFQATIGSAGCSGTEARPGPAPCPWAPRCFQERKGTVPAPEPSAWGAPGRANWPQGEQEEDSCNSELLLLGANSGRSSGLIQDLGPGGAESGFGHSECALWVRSSDSSFPSLSEMPHLRLLSRHLIRSPPGQDPQRVPL